MMAGTKDWHPRWCSGVSQFWGGKGEGRCERIGKWS